MQPQLHTISHDTPPAGHAAPTGPVFIGDLEASVALSARLARLHPRLQARWMQAELQERGNSVRRLCLRWEVVGEPDRRL